MSQRLRSSPNNPNIEIIQCDAYSASFQKKGKSAPMPVIKVVQSPCKNMRSHSKSKLLVPNLNVVIPKAKRNAAYQLQQQQLQLQKERNMAPASSNIIQKDTYNNGAPVMDVTVKTQKKKSRSRSNSCASSTETWSKLLKRQSSNEEVSSFTKFDPLRTLHFLAKELQMKLLNKMPTDQTVLQMIADMQLALNRVPADLMTASKRQLTNEFATASSTNLDLEPPGMLYMRETEISLQPKVSHKAIQTMTSSALIASERVQKHIEESTVKIEAACTQMEDVCKKLKNEKCELESLLNAEKQHVAHQQEKIRHLESEIKLREDESMTTVQQLAESKKSLEAQVQKLNAQLETQQSAACLDMKRLLNELQKKKALAEQQSMTARHQLTLATMESEKLTAILATRDRQIEEIRGEMSQLQEVVNEQLVELQNVPCSQHSSVSNITDQSTWAQPDKEADKEIDKSEIGDTPAALASEKLEELYLKKVPSDGRRDLISANSSGTSTVLREMQNSGILNENGDEPSAKDAVQKPSSKNLEYKSSNEIDTNSITTTDYAKISEKQLFIKDIFEDIKKHAMQLSLPDDPYTYVKN